jgi:hypothetical protein
MGFYTARPNPLAAMFIYLQTAGATPMTAGATPVTARPTPEK